MGFFSGWWRPKKVEKVDTLAAVAEALHLACAERGRASFRDCVHIPVHRATIFRAIDKLVERGEFRRDGRHYYATDADNDADDDALVADVDAVPDGACSTFELQTKLNLPEHVSQSTTHYAGPDDPHRKICPPAPITYDEESPEHLNDAILAWADLQQHVPVSVLELARREWEGALQRGISPALTHANIIKRIPSYLKEVGFKELCRQYPKYKDTWTQFQKLIDEHVAAGASVSDAVAEVLRIVREVEEPGSPTSTPPPSTRIAPPSDDEYGMAIAGRRREVGNLEAFRRADENDLHALYSGKNRMRTHVHMDQKSASTSESLIVDACRGQQAEHNARQAAKANGDAPSLVSRMKSWFD